MASGLDWRFDWEKSTLQLQVFLIISCALPCDSLIQWLLFQSFDEEEAIPSSQKIFLKKKKKERDEKELYVSIFQLK